MINTTNLRKLSRVFGVMAITALLGAGVALAGGGSTCTTAQIDEPFILPDGAIHEAGALTVCVERRFSPISHQHTMLVDGNAVGVHIGRTSESEGPATNGSYFMFGRGVDGRLRLLGYARPGTDRMEIHSLRHATHLTADSQLADRVREEPVFVAALAR